MKKTWIVIAEDNDDLRKLIRISFTGHNAHLIETRNGMAAYEWIRRIRPAIAILDIMMPGEMDGLKICQMIKTNPALADTKVIFVSARGQKADIEEGELAGADSYLVKPFSPKELIGVCQQLTDKLT